MAVDRNRYQQLKHGVGHEAALILADTTKTPGQAATVAAPTALTSSVGVAATTKAEYDALRTDVNNLRTTVANLLTSLKAAGTVL